MKIEAIAPGQRVTFVYKDNYEPEGVVVNVAVGSKLTVTYQVAWWSMGSRNAAWLDECEIAPCEGQHKRIAIEVIAEEAS